MKMLNTIIMISPLLGGSEFEGVNGENTPTIRYVMPAEGSPHEGTWLQWPHKYQYGEIYRDRIEPTWIAMTRELALYEKVHIIAYDIQAQQQIVDKLEENEVPLSNIDFYIFKTNDVWIRDNGPIFVRNKENSALTIEGWGFNGWGDKEPYNYCAQIPHKVATAIHMPLVELDKKMMLEGGAVELDGQGTLMATRSSILNNNRNPKMTQKEAEAFLSAYLGVTNFIWLDGVAGVDITDMHIDGFARFGENNTIVTMGMNDLKYWGLPQSDIDRLYRARNRQGDVYKYVTLPLTKNNVTTTYGKKLDSRGSYVNYYVANNRVLVPTYNDPNDIVAISIIDKLYPNRTVLGIDVCDLYESGGMIHCITQQQPKTDIRVVEE